MYITLFNVIRAEKKTAGHFFLGADFFPLKSVNPIYHTRNTEKA